MPHKKKLVFIVLLSSVLLIIFGLNTIFNFFRCHTKICIAIINIHLVNIIVLRKFVANSNQKKQNTPLICWQKVK